MRYLAFHDKIINSHCQHPLLLSTGNLLSLLIVLGSGLETLPPLQVDLSRQNGEAGGDSEMKRHKDDSPLATDTDHAMQVRRTGIWAKNK